MTPRFNLLTFAILAAIAALASLASWCNRRYRIVEDYPDYGDM